MTTNYLIVGLGNPGEQYEATRHNFGRMAVEAFAKLRDFPAWEREGKANALCARGKVAKKSAELALPETFMNKSGAAAAYLARVRKVKPEHIVVAYDDIDLPFGSMKISFGRGSGGHRGVESVIKALKTRDFVRVRFGIAPTTTSGKIKKPSGEDKVLKFLLSNFKKEELAALKKLFEKTTEALAMIVEEGRERAMNEFN